MRTALLFTTHLITPGIIENFLRVITPFGWEKILFLDASRREMSEIPFILREDLRCECFTFKSHVIDTGYSPIKLCLIPGSNHYPIIQYLITSDFDVAWQVEHDVMFKGRWLDFFQAHEFSNSDFLSAHMHYRAHEPRWHWWDSLHSPVRIEQDKCVKSFNPIYRITRNAACALDSMFREGWRGHHEAAIPTFLHFTGFKIEDFGGWSEFVSPTNRGKWYSNISHSWRRAFGSINDLDEGLIIHPCKWIEFE